jgi:lantibiotic modifying enzyme
MLLSPRDRVQEIALQGLTPEERSWKTQPGWLRTFRSLQEYLSTVVTEPDAGVGIVENLAAPMVTFAWQTFVSVNQARVGMLSLEAALALRNTLSRRLGRTASQAANWEVQAATADRSLLRNFAQGNKPSVHGYFFSGGVEDEVIGLLKNHPALARLWSLQIEAWLKFFGDFLRHAADLARRSKFEPHISSLQADLSDPHEGNKTVVRVEFGEDRQWFYKPRQGRQERDWFGLLGWINGQGFPYPFQILAVICRDTHCWMERAQPRKCRDENEASALCFRLGALMYLVHLLRGVDFHPENVVAAGDQPVIVDCETLLHPDTFLPQHVRAEDASIRRSGMLTIVKQLAAGRMAGLEPRERVKHLISGFRTIHGFVRGRDEVVRHLKKWAQHLSKIPARNIYRPTAYYHALLEGSLTPSLLASGVGRSLFLQEHCEDGVTSPQRARAEARALEDGDIPVFRSKPPPVAFDLSEGTLLQSKSMIQTALAGGVQSLPGYVIAVSANP